MQKYTLEELVEIFKVHSLEYEKQREEQIKFFKDKNPDQELPEYFNDRFSISQALQFICEEIISMRNEMNKNIHFIALD